MFDPKAGLLHQLACEAWCVTSDLVPHFGVIPAQHLMGGERQKHDAIWPDDPGHLSDCGSIVVYALHHIERRHDIEGIGVERDAGDIRTRDRPSGGVRGGAASGRQIETNRTAVGAKKTEVVSSATAAIEQPEIAAPRGQPVDDG